MNQIPNSKNYDLEERTLRYAQRNRDYIKKLPVTLSNTEYSRQGIRASASVAANYIEANESFSRKDFIFRVRISKKEVKENRLWLNLIMPLASEEHEKQYLIKESDELMKIFGAIIENSIRKS